MNYNATQEELDNLQELVHDALEKAGISYLGDVRVRCPSMRDYTVSFIVPRVCDHEKVVPKRTAPKPTPKYSGEVAESVDRQLALLHAHLVIMGMGHVASGERPAHQELGDMPIRDVLRNCYLNNVTMEVLFTDTDLLRMERSKT